MYVNVCSCRLLSPVCVGTPSVRVAKHISTQLQGCLEMVTPVLAQGSVTARGAPPVKFRQQQALSGTLTGTTAAWHNP